MLQEGIFINFYDVNIARKLRNKRYIDYIYKFIDINKYDEIYVKIRYNEISSFMNFIMCSRCILDASRFVKIKNSYSHP